MWYKLEQDTLKLNITDSAKIVYTILADAQNSFEDVRMSKATIANRAGISIRTVGYALSELEREMLIRRYRTGRASYYLVLPIKKSRAQILPAEHEQRKTCEDGLGLKE